MGDERVPLEGGRREGSCDRLLTGHNGGGVGKPHTDTEEQGVKHHEDGERRGVPSIKYTIINPRMESLHRPSRLRSARTYEERKTPEAMSQEPTSRA